MIRLIVLAVITLLVLLLGSIVSHNRRRMGVPQREVGKEVSNG